MSNKGGRRSTGEAATGADMDLRLTDLLACPRCGPPHGLVLLADRVEDRRVLEGLLGCPNCGGRYPVRAGLADLRVPGEAGARAPAATPESGSAPAAAGVASPVAAVAPVAESVSGAETRAGAAAATRLAALMGLGGAGTVG